MSKFNSRFSHLRINVGNEELSNTAQKPKTNYFRDPNTFRIQSPKHINTLTNRPVQVIYTSPMTSKNESNKYLITNYNITNTVNNQKNGSSYLHSMTNKTDKIDHSKTGKNNLLNIIKSNLRAKNQFEINHNVINLHNSNNPGNIQRGNHLTNNFLSTKSNSLTREKQYSVLNNEKNNLNHMKNYNKFGNKNNENLDSNNYISSLKKNQNLNSQKENNNYLHSEGNVQNYNNIQYRNDSLNKQTNNNSQEKNHTNKSNLELQKVLKDNNIDIMRTPIHNNNMNDIFLNNGLSSKRENYLQQNYVKSDRNIKSLSPNLRLEAPFSSEQRKKLQIKNSAKYFNNPLIRGIGMNQQNNVQNESTTYDERVVHTDVSPANIKNNKPEYIDIMKLISTNQPPISLNVLNKKFDNFENSKYSTKSLKYIKGYSANTHQGTVRNYNEDRVSIILNVVKPNSFTGDYWPKISIFGIYDGHGGATCADFLRDHLHQYVIRNPHFPNSPKEAIQQGFENAEKDFLTNYALDKNEEVLDRSGSCALMAFIIDDICYVANTGDSRSISSRSNGEKIQQLTYDHKPNQKGEEFRIIQAGGKVYQTQTPTQNINLSVLQNSFNIDINSIGNNHIIVGPSRAFPGRLSVSRSFGDVEAKLPKLGGMPGVIVATPDITSFKIDSDIDFLVLGCDGIYDQLSNKDIINSIWMTTQENVKLDDVHQQCSLSNDFIIKSCLNRKCLDNITLVIVAFDNFDKIFNYPVLHTYEEAPVSKKLLGADTIYSTRTIKRPNFEKITKIRCESHKNYNIPSSYKGNRPKITNLEDSSLRDNPTNKNLNHSIKNLTPLNSAKERNQYFDNSNLKIGKNVYLGGINRNTNEKAKFYFNNLITMQSEEKKNVSYNIDRDNLNQSNYVKSISQNRKIVDKSREESKIKKNESIISNSFLQKRKNN